MVVVQENRKGNAGPAGIYDVAVYICQFEAQGAQGNGAVQFHEMALVGSCLHNVANAFVDNHFADDILTQRPLDVGSRCEGAASEQQLRVRIHGDEGKDLQGAVDEGGPEQKPRARVGSDRQHRPVEGLQGLVDPVEVLAPVRAEEGVGHTKLEDGELGARLEVEGFPDVKLEGGVVSGDSLAAVHVDSGAHPFLTSPEATPRRLLGACAVPDPLRAGPPGLHDCLAAGAAVDVVTLTVADRAAPQDLAHHLAQDRPHFQSQSVPPSACRTFRPGASGSG